MAIFDEINARIETYAEGDYAIEADEAQLYEIEQKIESVKDAAKAFDSAEQALAGCIVTIGNTGALHIGAAM